MPSPSEKNDSEEHRITEVVDIEKAVCSAEYGLKAKIDVLLEVSKTSLIAA